MTVYKYFCIFSRELYIITTDSINYLRCIYFDFRTQSA